MTRKVLSMVLAAAMVLSLLAGITFSAGAAEINTSFAKISALTELTDGEYLIVADHGEDFHAMVSPADATATVMGDSGVITLTNHVIVYDGTVVTDAAIWTITKDTATGKFTIADKNGKYLNGHGKNQAVVSETAEEITITESGTIPGTFIIDDTNTTYPHLNYNYNNGNGRFAFYGAINNSASMKGNLFLYKAGGIFQPCTHEHTENVAAVPATCTEPGTTAGVRCTDCGEIVSGCEEVAALGHDYVDGICSRCGAEEPEEVDYSGRYYIAAKRVTGNYWYMTSDLGTATTHRYQAVDSGVETLPEVVNNPDALRTFDIAKSGEKYVISAEGEVTNNYLGWTSGNSGTLVAQADAAEFTITEGSEPGTVHIAINTDRVLALNSYEGNDFFAFYNSQIQDLTLVPVSGEAHMHTWDAGVITTPATCTDDGVKTYTCSGCNETRTEVIPALGHDWDDGVVTTPATCTDDGVKTYTCSRCNETRTEDVPALGHDYVDGICSRCGAEEPPPPDYSGRYAIIALRSNGYFYLTGTLTSTSTQRYTAVAAELETIPEEIETPVENGIFVIAQSGNGYKISVEGMTGDNYLSWVSGNSGALAAEADAPVLTIAEGTETGTVQIAISGGDRILALNNNTSSDFFAWYGGTQIKDLFLVPIAANAHTHNWGEGVVTTAATCTEDGVMTYTCSVCQETRTEVIPALGHDFVNGICSRCGAEEEVPVSDYSGRYYIAAKRTTGNYFYMTGVLTETSVTRYVAEDSTLVTLPSAITESAAGYVFVITKSGTGYTVNVEGTDNYLGWTSGNSGALVSVSEAAVVGIADNGDGTVLITIPDRNLALNNSTGNNYFAWYTSAQANHITLIPVNGNAPEHTHTLYHFEGDAATCESDGYRAYYTCTDPTCGCYGKMYEDDQLTIEIEDILIPALGHDLAYTDNGDGTHRIACTRCDYVEDEAAFHEFHDGSCICGAAEEFYDPALVFLSRNLNLQSYIGVDYTVSTAKALRNKYSEFYVVAEINGTQTTLTQISAATSYRVCELKTTSTQMTEAISATVYAVGINDGETYHGPVNEWCVRDGIMALLANETDAGRRQLEVDMLKYGAAAQIVFEKNIDDLADAELGDYAQYATTTNPVISATTSVSGSGVAFRTKSLSLASSIEMQFMFSYKSLNFDNLEARIVHDGVTKVVELSRASTTYAGFSYEGLASNELRKNITVAVYDKTTNEPVTQILTVSIEALAAEKLDSYASDPAKLELLNAVMRYGDSAAAVYGN